MKKRAFVLILPLAGLAAATLLGFRFRMPGSEKAPGGTAPAAPFQGELFAPGVVSTSDDEFGTAFTPDGREVYFARRSPTTSTSPVQAIFFSRLEGGRWSTPEVAPFSGVWPDFAPAIAPDGSKLFFASLRPREGTGIREDTDIWVVDRIAAGWSAPRNLGAPVDTDRNDSSPSVAADGTLYFGSDRDGGAGSVDIWRAPRQGDGYGTPEHLDAAINTAAFESQPAISPDQNLLVFTSGGRPEIAMTGGAIYPRADLYASVRVGGAWQPAVNLGPAVNTPASETSPAISPDGKRLFFTSERGFTAIPMPPGLTLRSFEESAHGILNGRGNIYSIALDRLGLGPAKPAKE